MMLQQLYPYGNSRRQRVEHHWQIGTHQESRTLKPACRWRPCRLYAIVEFALWADGAASSPWRSLKRSRNATLRKSAWLLPIDSTALTTDSRSSEQIRLWRHRPILGARTYDRSTDQHYPMIAQIRRSRVT